MSTAIDTQTRPVYLGRQAIYDSAGDAVAYELLYRDRPEALFAAQRGAMATAQVLVAAFTAFRLDELIGPRAAFVNLTTEFVLGDLPLPVEPSQVGVEIPDGVAVGDAFVAGVAALAAQGFTIVLDNFRAGQGRDALLPYATYVKVDLLAADRPPIAAALAELEPHPNAQRIAYRLQDAATVELAMELGFHLFQGNALGHPHVLSTRIPALAPERVAEVLALLRSPAPDLERVAAAVGGDPGLAMHVRRAAENSAPDSRSPAGANPAAEAVSSLGLQRMTDWTTLVASIAPASRSGAGS